jgi:hypothetical protein
MKYPTVQYCIYLTILIIVVLLQCSSGNDNKFAESIAKDSVKRTVLIDSVSKDTNKKAESDSMNFRFIESAEPIKSNDDYFQGSQIYIFNEVFNED